MKIKTKLNLSFLILVLALMVTGFMGINATQKIRKNHTTAEQVTELLLIKNKMIAITAEVISIHEPKHLQELQAEFHKLSKKFALTHSQVHTLFSHSLLDELTQSAKALEDISQKIFDIHNKKLQQDIVFDNTYPQEKKLRRAIRNILFQLKYHDLTEKMGEVQYLSKETLYQHRDKKHLDKWLTLLSELKTLIQELKPYPLPERSRQELLTTISEYAKTAMIMGDIAVMAKTIEQEQRNDILILEKIVTNSEVTSQQLKAKIAQASTELENSILFTQITLIIVVVLGAFIFSLFISNSIGRVVTNLRHGVQKVSQGELETKITIDTKDEFSNLAQAFNQMTKELKTTKHSLEDTNRHLEDKVSERTVNLQQAIEEIKQTNNKLTSLSSKLSKYLSPQVYQSIFLGKKDVKLESYRKELTIFFSDIQGFTSITDSMESESLASLLNNYLDEMAEIALRYGGTIDKFIGDAVMAFFGDPESQGKKQDAINCVKMALEMRERMKSLRQKWVDSGISQPLHIRMGINTGFCTVGNFGSESRLDYTIIGGQVNLASRLESNAEANQILISHETYALIKDEILCEKKEQIMVKGIAHPIQTYQVIGIKKEQDAKNKQLTKSFEGFNLNIDLEEASKEEVVKALEESLKRFT